MSDYTEATFCDKLNDCSLMPGHVGHCRNNPTRAQVIAMRAAPTNRAKAEAAYKPVRNTERAEAARTVARELGDTLFEKQMAYGDSGALALAIWEARLKQYLTPDGTHYLIPKELIAHIPRLTRVDDRINRIVSNPAGDRMSEDPWRDLAGDAIIGVIMPRFPSAVPAPAECYAVHPMNGHQCERPDDHGGPHSYVHSGARVQWTLGPQNNTVTSVDPGETGLPNVQ